MFRAIGFVIVLYALSQFFASSMSSFNKAVTATLQTLEAAAIVSQEHIEELK